MLLFVIGHVNLTVKSGLTEYTIIRGAILSISRSLLEPGHWLQFAIPIRRSYVRLFLRDLWQAFSLTVCLWIVSRTLDSFLILNACNLISHLSLARDGIHIFTFVGISEILRTTIANNWVPVFLLKHFLLRTKHLRILFYYHVLLLVWRRWDELLNRELQTFLQLFATIHGLH